MTLHGVDGKFQGLCDVRWIQILLVSQQHDSAWHGCQPANERLEMLPQQRIIITFGSNEPKVVIDRNRLHTMLLPQPVDGASRRHLPQPEHEMWMRLDRADAAMELQKDLLR